MNGYVYFIIKPINLLLGKYPFLLKDNNIKD